MIPASLRAIPNWLVWRPTQVAGQKKPRKIPHYANGSKRYGDQGSDADRAQLATFDKAEAARDGGDFSGLGFGVLPDCGVIALDFDACVVDGVVDPRVMRVIAGTYAEYSPSGTGVRAFFKGSGLVSVKDNVKEPQIEVFGTSGFVTVTGRQLPEHALIGWDEIVDVTPVVLEYVEGRFGHTEVSDSDLMGLKPRLDVSLERVQEVLAALPPDMAYDDWVKVGMAIQHQTDDFEVFHAWSTTSPKYTTRDYCWERWRSFGRNSRAEPITFAWVLKVAGANAALVASKSHMEVIEACMDATILRTRVADTVRQDERLQPFDFEILAKAMQGRFGALGIKLPIAAVRKLLVSRRVASGDLPGWAEGWVYVTDEDKFMRVGRDEWVTKQGFDARYNRKMPDRSSASAAGLEQFGLPVVAKALYVPWADTYFEHNGHECVNLYRHDSPPVPLASSSGAEALVLAHIDLICNGRAAVARKLVQWLAYQVQNPGKKVRWAPLIKGVEGDGKSAIADLLQGVMGGCNVRMISPKVIGTDFTGWARGACVGVLEELKLTGHNRHDVLNALKPYITNSTVEVHQKGRDPYNAHNTQNYIAFTNHSDALPLNDTDRRWFVIFTPWSNIADLRDRVGDTVAYFDRYFDAIQNNPAALRRWLLDVDLTDFQPNASAPMTDEKAQMVQFSVSDEESAAREAIEAGGHGITQWVLSSACLTAKLQLEGVVLQTHTVRHVLQRLGWVQAPKRVKESLINPCRARELTNLQRQRRRNGQRIADDARLTRFSVISPSWITLRTH